MPIATHLIKVKGEIRAVVSDDLKEYVDEKIVNEIDLSFHATLEKFEVKGNHAEVWVYLHAFPSEISQEVIEEWLKDHIKEPDISLRGFEIVEIANLLNPPAHEFCIFLEYSKKQLRKLIERI
jgi:hypothetical protein